MTNANVEKRKRKNTKNANRTEVNNYEKLEISTGE